MKLFLPVILIAVGIGGYFLITQPVLDEIAVLQAEADSYDEALSNSKILQAERDRLTDKYNSFRQNDLDRLFKMVPDSVDNIQLILEIQEEAARRGIVVQNVEFEPEVDEEELAEGEEAPVRKTSSRAPTGLENLDYEEFELEFSVEGSYDNFVSFMALVERSLRLVDINQISFTPGTSEDDELYTDFYKYLFRINTYRLVD